MKFYEAVEKKYDPELGQRVLTFPETEPCEICGGPRYVPVGFPPGSRVDDPHLAIQIRLVEFGYTGDFKDTSKPEPLPCCQLGDARFKVRSALKLGEKWGVFPTLSVCSGCGGHSGYLRGKTVKVPDLAWRLALVQFGNTTCKHYDNEPPSHACDCKEKLRELDRQVGELPLVSDSGWKRSGGIPRRGITDYARSMEFSRDLAPEEVDLLREWLQRKDCPGWTGIGMRAHGKGRYGFTTTWDSSD